MLCSIQYRHNRCLNRRLTYWYVSIRYTERLAEAAVEPPVGNKGDSYDNALAETINGLHKAELIYRQSRKSQEAVEMASLKWVHWYNHQWLLSSIGNICGFHGHLATHSMSIWPPIPR